MIFGHAGKSRMGNTQLFLTPNYRDIDDYRSVYLHRDKVFVETK